MLVGADVWTGDSLLPRATVIAGSGDTIVFVGDSSDARQWVDARTVVRDAGGRLVIPGLNDAHLHVGERVPVTLVFTADSTDPHPNPSISEALALLRAAGSATPGPMLRMRVGERILDDPRARRSMLDALIPWRPVILTGWPGHGAVLNGAALDFFGISDSTSDPLGGVIERTGASGRPSGLLTEYAWWDAWRNKEAEMPDSVATREWHALSNEALSYGITSVQVFAEFPDARRELEVACAAAVPLRVRLVDFPTTTAHGRERTALSAAKCHDPARRVRLSGVKYIMDGTPVERLAFVTAPWADRPGSRGGANFSLDSLTAWMREARALGIQPQIHAVGDSAVQLVLAALEGAGSDADWRALRPRIEHGDFITPAQITRLRELGGVIVQNPAHLSIAALMRSRTGGRTAPLQPLRSLDSAGVHFAIGSDGPLNPFLNLMLATVHPVSPPEALSRERALRAYTAGSAFAEAEEANKGVLRVGAMSDLAVLSQNVLDVPTQELPATRSVFTMVGGRVAYDDGTITDLRGGASRK
jgi:predicted amidohydrolase YtcJ